MSHEFYMEMTGERGDSIAFDRRDEVCTDAACDLYIGRELWEEIGKPEHIHVFIDTEKDMARIEAHDRS